MTTTTENTGTTVETLTGDYQVDPTHSRLGFAAKHAMVATVRGQFKVYSGEVHLDEENPENSWAKVEIDVASVDTGNADRDAHLRTPDFFDIEKYPTITFVSTKVEKVDGDVFTLIGDLTINDKTNPVSTRAASSSARRSSSSSTSRPSSRSHRADAHGRVRTWLVKTPASSSSPCPVRTGPASFTRCRAFWRSAAATSSTRSSTAAHGPRRSSFACTSPLPCRWMRCVPSSEPSRRRSAWTGT